MGTVLTDLGTYLDRGGPVMIVLGVLALVLWYALGLRMYTLRRGTRYGVKKLLKRSWIRDLTSRNGIVDSSVAICTDIARGHRGDRFRAMEDALWDLRTEMRAGSAVVRTVVAVAPLLGLLGTVSGMIETFDSLAGMELHSSSGGVAGGISEALFTTQMGLAVSVPGLVVGRILDGRQRRMNQELDQVRDGALALAQGDGP